MNIRRRLLIGIGALAALPAFAQQPARVRRVGWLSFDKASGVMALDTLPKFESEMRQLGYVEGRNIAYDLRFADGDVARLPQLAAELVALDVDVIFAVTGDPAYAAHRATDRIPIIAYGVANPVGVGLVQSLAKPGGNVTGISSNINNLNAKYVELIHTAIPGLKTIGVLQYTDVREAIDVTASLREAAAARGIGIRPSKVRNAAEIEAAFKTFASQRVRALILAPNGVFLSQVDLLNRLAARYRIATLYWHAIGPERGALMSYGNDRRVSMNRAAAMVDKILKGTRPADIPYEEPYKLELVINKKTAAAIGLKLPQELLLRADRMIE